MLKLFVRRFSSPIASQRICPKGLDCSKYEFNYIGKIKDTECCEQYIKNLVSYYTTEDSHDATQECKKTIEHTPDNSLKHKL
jgi:hypothetical protein